MRLASLLAKTHTYSDRNLPNAVRQPRGAKRMCALCEHPYVSPALPKPAGSRGRAPVAAAAAKHPYPRRRHSGEIPISPSPP